MFLIAWILIGAVLAVAANKLFYREPRSLVADLVLSVFGAVVGGFVLNVMLRGAVAQVQVWSLVAAVMGSLILIGGFHALRRTGLG